MIQGKMLQYQHQISYQEISLPNQQGLQHNRELQAQHHRLHLHLQGFQGLLHRQNPQKGQLKNQMESLNLYLSNNQAILIALIPPLAQ